MRAWQIFVAGMVGVLTGAVMVLLFQKPPPPPELMGADADYQELVNQLDAHGEHRKRLENKLEQLDSGMRQLRDDLRALSSKVQQMAQMPIGSYPTEASVGAASFDPWGKEMQGPGGAARPGETAEADSARQLVEQQNQARLERHDAIHQQETVDPYWAQATTQKITDAFTRANVTTSQISQVDCRTTRCRVVIFHENQAAHREFQQALSGPSGISSVLPHATFSYFELEDGSMETVMFLYKNSLRSGS